MSARLDVDFQDGMIDAQDSLTAISRWIDESPANVARPAVEATLLRFMKIGEEYGEMVAEIIGMTGQNPRKGVTSDLDKVIDEALDVALTALAAVEHATGNQCLAFGLLFNKIAKVDDRRLGLPSADAVASDVQIDKALEAL